MVRDANIEEMSQVVFSASPLGGYITRPTKAVGGVVEQIWHTTYLDSGCGDLEIGRLMCAVVQLSVQGVGGGR
jgi:hypothetical protein